MDTLGNSEVAEAISAAARKALHDWGRSMDELDDLIQETWVWYLARPSVQAFVENAKTATGRRNALHRGAVQILSEQQLQSNVFRGQELYSSEAVRDWLHGKSTNKGIGKLISKGLSKLDDQNSDHRDAIRLRYEMGRVPSRGSSEEAVLKRAVKSLTSHVNALAIEARADDKMRPNDRPSSVTANKRRGTTIQDPTAELALGLIHGGDIEYDVWDGSTTTYRQEFEMQTLPIGTGATGGQAEWLDLFEGSVNDRTDMYRATVFPELYPDEPPMLTGNWDREDLAAYAGGEYTDGYRRLRVVR